MGFWALAGHLWTMGGEGLGLPLKFREGLLLSVGNGSYPLQKGVASLYILTSPSLMTLGPSSHCDLSPVALTCMQGLRPPLLARLRVIIKSALASSAHAPQLVH